MKNRKEFRDFARSCWLDDEFEDRDEERVRQLVLSEDKLARRKPGLVAEMQRSGNGLKSGYGIMYNVTRSC